MRTTARVMRFQKRQLERGGCRACGNLLEPRSASRCSACLGPSRLNARRRRGILTAEQRPRGRPMLGSVEVRRRARVEEEQRRQRSLDRKAGRLPLTRVELEHEIARKRQDGYVPVRDAVTDHWVWRAMTILGRR